jgi:SOUL heme-binding protein
MQIDPLLTPQTKRIQDGTRAVARQVTSDILPGLAQTAAASRQTSRRRSTGSGSSSSSTSDWFPQPPVPLPLASMEAAVADLSKVGDRLFNLAQRQFQRGLDEISRDLADPSRIPDRVTKQATELFRETLNVFAETPIDLKEPTYRVVMTTDDYEIRDYDTYRVASTRAASADADQGSTGGSSAVDSWAQDGAAFATLASYVLGGNQESQVLEMTTPVTTTMTGEMRFFLALPDDRDAPQPMDASTSASVEIQTLPPARLAVRKFPGFVTDGEVSRQKQALLTALELDGIELDVRHGQTVPHVIFQYNPPYTVPVLRRNEIAVPVVGPSDQVEAELRNRDTVGTSDEFWSDDA